MIDDVDRDQAFNEQYLQTLIAQSRERQSSTPSQYYCLDCGESIPEKRRQLIPGVRLCIHCQLTRERSP